MARFGGPFYSRVPEKPRWLAGLFSERSPAELCAGDFVHDQRPVNRRRIAARLTPVPLPESRAPAARVAAPAAPHGVAIYPPRKNRSGAAPERRLRSPTAPGFREIAAPRRPREVRQSR